MTETAIDFDRVTKTFQVWHDRPHSVKALITQLSTFRFKAGHRENVTVLKDISLQVRKGDFVGIMGRNGVGKSTLLKLISRIYQPTSGTLTSRGRIAPLLELGAGFATELNGLENIFLNASILGFSRQEVNAKIEQIVEFSELKTDLEKPVRNYSSGMMVRLGFSIASHLDADILLFDEILAVGDVGFQAKCLKKINELHRAGKTIVLVTHTPEQVEQFCNRCVVIERTGVIFDGPPHKGVGVYKGLF